MDHLIRSHLPSHTDDRVFESVKKSIYAVLKVLEKDRAESDIGDSGDGCDLTQTPTDSTVDERAHVEITHEKGPVPNTCFLYPWMETLTLTASEQEQQTMTNVQVNPVTLKLSTADMQKLVRDQQELYRDVAIASLVRLRLALTKVDTMRNSVPIQGQVKQEEEEEKKEKDALLPPPPAQPIIEAVVAKIPPATNVAKITNRPTASNSKKRKINVPENKYGSLLNARRRHHGSPTKNE